MGHPAETENGRFTYRDYLKWPDGERWEIIDGEAFAMTPAPSRVHQAILVALVVQFYQQIVGTPCQVYPAPFDVRLPKGGEADAQVETVVQPDIVVVCDPSKLDDRGCKGAPDLVVEIVSPFTAVMDRKRKFAIYERAGVKEYWIIQPVERLVTIFALSVGGEYGKPIVFGHDEKIPVSILGDVVIDLQPVFTE